MKWSFSSRSLVKFQDKKIGVCVWGGGGGGGGGHNHVLHPTLCYKGREL